MAAAIVSIICIAMIVVGGMTLSHGIMTSADSAAVGVEAISIREGEIMRTDIALLHAVELHWSDYLRLTVKNTGQTKLSSFNKWDVMVTYTDSLGTSYSKWLPYTIEPLTANRWVKARIGLEGPTDYFEPGILNPSEELVILASLDPLPGDATNIIASVVTPNGIDSSMSFPVSSQVRLVPESGDVSLNSARYYELVETTAVEGTAMTFSTQFVQGETGRKLLENTEQSSRPARFVYPLVGIKNIPAAAWTVFYHSCVFGGGGEFPLADSDVAFNIDIVVRQADGTIRDTIATGVASAFINLGQEGSWMTPSGTFAFLGYSVINENDYLEIDFYAQTGQGPGTGTGYLQLSIDDSSLGITDQTRIES
jgi:hypothetical protein